MTGLPPGLRAWEPLLDRFEPELALSLGPWLPRLSLAVGPLHTTARSGDGEPDGYSGLARRGSYDRLLLTEWAVAEVAPDEFTRRAAMGEHLFLHPRRQEPAGRQRAIVLFDAGPDQLGAPRLAHLALLLVMARRAERAGIPLAFGVLQGADLVPWADAGQLTNLLAARATRAPTAEDVRRWQGRIEATAGDDLWLVGGPGAVGPGSCVRVEEPVEPGDRTLRVEVRPLTGPARQVALALPAPGDAVRLLRDPFARAAAAPRAISGAGGGEIRFSHDGRRLFGWDEAGRVVAWHVPNSPHAGQDGRARYLRPPDGHGLVAAGLHGRHIAALTCETRRARCVGWPRQRFAGDFPLALPTAPAGGPMPPCFVTYVERGEALVFVDVDGDLWRVPLRADATGRGPIRMDSAVLAARHYDNRVVWVRREESGECVLRRIGAPPVADAPIGPGPGRAFFGDGSPIAHSAFGLLGVALDDGRWRLQYGDPDRRDRTVSVDLRPPDGSQVVGVVTRPVPRAIPGAAEHEPAIVVRDEGGSALWVLSARTSFRVPTRAVPIVAACVSPVAPYVAWRTADGALSVWSLRHDAYVARLVPSPQGALKPAIRWKEVPE